MLRDEQSSEYGVGEMFVMMNGSSGGRVSY